MTPELTAALEAIRAEAKFDWGLINVANGEEIRTAIHGGEQENARIQPTITKLTAALEKAMEHFDNIEFAHQRADARDEILAILKGDLFPRSAIKDIIDRAMNPEIFRKVSHEKTDQCNRWNSSFGYWEESDENLRHRISLAKEDK